MMPPSMCLLATIAFVERAGRLIDHPFDVMRSKAVPY
jgi:hypothetical protein